MKELRFKVGRVYTSSNRLKFSAIVHYYDEKEKEWKKEIVNWTYFSRNKCEGEVILNSENYEDGTIIRYICKTRKGTSITYYIVENNEFKELKYNIITKKVEDYRNYEIWAKIRVLENGFEDVVYYFIKGDYKIFRLRGAKTSIEECKRDIDYYYEEYYDTSKVKITIPQNIIKELLEKKRDWCDGIVVIYEYRDIHKVLPVKKSKKAKNSYYCARYWREIEISEATRKALVNILSKVCEKMDKDEVGLFIRSDGYYSLVSPCGELYYYSFKL